MTDDRSTRSWDISDQDFIFLLDKSAARSHLISGVGITYWLHKHETFVCWIDRAGII